MTSKKMVSNSRSDTMKVNTDNLKESISRHLHYTLGKDLYSATKRDWFSAVVYTVRDYLMEKWLATHRSYHGNVREFIDERGQTRHDWGDCEEVMAMAYDIPVPGYKCRSVTRVI